MVEPATLCGPCDRSHKSANAVKYCTDCDEGLCEMCESSHAAIKVTQSHFLMDISIFRRMKCYVNKQCKKHSGYKLKFYCKIDDCLCCRNCIESFHETCGAEIITLELAAKGIKNSSMYHNVLTDINSLSSFVQHVIDNRIKCKEKIEGVSSNVRGALDKLKEQLDLDFKKFEKKCLKKVDKIRKNQLPTFYDEIKNFSQRKQQLLEMLDHVQVMSDHGSDEHMFIVLEVLKDKTLEQVGNVEQLTNSLDNNECYVLFSEKSFDFTSYLSIEVKPSQSNIPYTPCNRLCEAQMVIPRQKMPKDVQLQHHKSVRLPGKTTCITSINDDDMLLCNENDKDKSLILWNKSGFHIQDILSEAFIWAAALISGKDEAILTMPYDKSIQFLFVRTMTPGMRANTPCECYGVAIIRGEVLLGAI